MNKELPVLLDEAKVAEILGVQVKTLQQWRSYKRNLPFIRVSSKCVRYRMEDIDEFLEASLVRVSDSFGN